MRSVTLTVGLLTGGLLIAGHSPAGAQAVDLSVCQYLTRHRPAPDVEYTPGVDVKGRAVAPADLPGSGGLAIDRFDIPVTLGLARRLGYPVPGVLPPDTEIGTLTLQGDRLTFNGQPLGSAREAELYAICRTR